MPRIAQGERALILSDGKDRTLIVSDLHLGIERELLSMGIRVQKQSRRLANRIDRLVKQYSISRLVILGDVKHDVAKLSQAEWTVIPEFFEALLKSVDKIHVIPGNHDGGLDALAPKEVKIEPAHGMMLKEGRSRIWLCHGHAWPNSDAFSCELLIMGHHHFLIELRDSSGFRLYEPVWLVAKCDTKRIVEAYARHIGQRLEGEPLSWFKREFGNKPRLSRLIVIPALSNLVGGVPINRKEKEYLGPIFKSGAIDAMEAELYLLDGTPMPYQGLGLA